MAWLIKVIAASKDVVPAPDETKHEKRVFTNFIR
jgi:hypothetical protein